MEQTEEQFMKWLVSVEKDMGKAKFRWTLWRKRFTKLPVTEADVADFQRRYSEAVAPATVEEPTLV